MSLLPLPTESVAEWRARWKKINDFTLEEARRKSPTERYRSFLRLVATAKSLGWKTSTAKEDAEAARQLRILREKLNGKASK
jgi:hypothetical protein